MKMYNFTTYLSIKDNTKATVILYEQSFSITKIKISPLIITIFVYNLLLFLYEPIKSFKIIKQLIRGKDRRN